MSLAQTIIKAPSQQNEPPYQQGRKEHLNHKNSTKVLQRKHLGILMFEFKWRSQHKMAVGHRRDTENVWVWEEGWQMALLALFHLGKGFSV